MLTSFIEIEMQFHLASSPRLQLGFALLPLLIGVVLLFAPDGRQVQAESGFARNPLEMDRLEPEKLIFLLQYLGTDYGAAVRDGQVISEFEYQEMLDFSEVLVHQYPQLDPASRFLGELERLRHLIEQKRDWSEILDLTRELIPEISRHLNVISYPTVVPNLPRGQKRYLETCAKCHGVTGDGNGPSAAELDPPPRSFQDDRMKQIAPHQIYNAITFGVEGTEMPSHLDSLIDQDRWNLAFYVLTLRSDFDPVVPERSLPLSLKDLAAHSNEELLGRLSSPGIAVKEAHLDHYRQNPPGPSPSDLLVLTRSKLKQSMEAFEQGARERSVNLALDAYLEGIEPLEPTLRQRAPSLVRELESRFFFYRAGIRGGASSEDVRRHHDSLQYLVTEAQEALAGIQAEAGFAFIQSMVIILREGIEAALLLAVMLTYLAAAGHQHLRKYVTGGAAAGILAGFATWIAAKTVLQLSALQQEALEGMTSLLAATVLFSVSLWMIHQLDIRRWKGYIQRRAEHALSTGSGFALASAAFLAVYREAVETVLFYEALWTRSDAIQSSIVIGFITGTAILAVLVVLMFKFGLRLPLKQFFGLTGITLGLLAFMFAGYGVRELQAIGWIKETPLDWMVRIPLLEVWPTLESCALQFGILLSFLIGWFWLGAPRRGLASAPARAR